jgi:hypothetical protein
VPPDRSAAAVALSQAQGATLLRLTPLRASLEELLMSEIEAAGRGSAAAQPEGAR